MSVVHKLVPAALLATVAGPAHAAVYWFHGVRGNAVSVCFVGDAVTSRPDRVEQVLRYLREFEYSVNVRFDYLGRCPASAVTADGNDSFAGDIRVVLPHTSGTKIPTWAGPEGTGPVPGKGCAMFRSNDGKYCDSTCNKDSNNDRWISWSDAPDDLAANRACLYNLKLGDDPWNATPYLNHTLHEFGHALGLAPRAHARRRGQEPAAPEQTTAAAKLAGTSPRTIGARSCTTGSPACGSNGNYDYTGLSQSDRLGLRILYPEANRRAEYVGATLRPAGNAVVLQLRLGSARREPGVRRHELPLGGEPGHLLQPRRLGAAGAGQLSVPVQLHGFSRPQLLYRRNDQSPAGRRVPASDRRNASGTVAALLSAREISFPTRPPGWSPGSVAVSRLRERSYARPYLSTCDACTVSLGGDCVGQGGCTPPARP